MVYHNNMWEFEDDNIISKLVSWLEENFYGLPSLRNKVYIWNKTIRREASYIWHYDNNPQELIKNIIYLTKLPN